MAEGKAKSADLDFTNVSDGGGLYNKRRFPEGDYKARIAGVTEGVAKSSGNKQWVFEIEVKHGGQIGTYGYYCGLVENQLWKIRGLFAAIGITIAKKRARVDPNKLVGKYIGVTLGDTEYNGKLQSQIDGVIPLSDIQANADDEDLDDEDVDTEESEDEEAAAEEEPEEEDDEEAEAERQRLAKRARAIARKKKADAEAAAAAAEEEEDDVIDAEVVEEEEEAPPLPARKKKVSAAPVKAAAKKPLATVPRGKTTVVDDDELDELELDDL